MPGCFAFLKPKPTSSVPDPYACDSKSPEYVHPPAYSFKQSPHIPAEHIKIIQSTIDGLSADLRKLSLDMHDHPETAWHEFRTQDILVKFMEKQDGWTVERNCYKIKPAFKAVFQIGKGGRTIGFNSEMDALPGVGHACGHNLIAIAGIAGALGVAAALKKTNTPGKVILLGTPAEETDGGKIKLINAGAYKPMDVCLMAHPGPYTACSPMLAVTQAEVKFTGRGAHAAGAPWEGINAQDAAINVFNSVSALRQQLSPEARVHGIIQGTEKLVPNIIPAECSLLMACRHPNNSENEKTKAKLENIFKAAALATGCEVKWKWQMAYKDLRNNDVMSKEFKAYMETEEDFPVALQSPPLGSTDFGDVSYVLPSLHPLFKIPVGPGEGNHTPGFTAAARTKQAHENTIKVAKGLSATAWRVVIDEEYFGDIKSAFEQNQKQV